MIAAAFNLFDKNGFAETTVEQVALEAGVSRRTAFRYFPTKESLVFPYRAERLERFTRWVKEAAETHPTPYAAVRRACFRAAEDYVADREMVLAQERIVRASPQLDGLERVLDDAYEQVLVQALGDPGDVRVAVEAAAIMASIRTILRMWLDRDDGRGDLVALGEEAFAYLEDGAFGG
ncbi:MAG: TetR family transcriptional regulator [Myxococcota bacterium]